MNRIYRTMQGKEIDMAALAAKNETMPAVGNVRVNARGDELGPNGQIVKTREEILAEYYDTDPKLVSEEELPLSKVKIETPKRKETVPEQVTIPNKTKSKEIK